MNKNLKITVSTPADNDYIDNKIVEFNNKQVPFTQSEPFINLNFVIKDSASNIVGGILAAAYCWRILYINVLWIDDKYRNQRYGSALLEHVEAQAKKIGCTLTHLDTFDFQAKDFYLRHGYEVFGTLDDCPPGHKKYFMKKKL